MVTPETLRGITTYPLSVIVLLVAMAVVSTAVPVFMTSEALRRVGANTVAIYAPRSLVAFMVGSVALHSIAESNAALLHADPWFAVCALLLTMSFAGLVQLAFGWAGFGALMKFIPSPVMAGFQNAAALLILYSQLHVLLGLPKRLAPLELMSGLSQMRPLNLSVGVATANFWMSESSVA